VRHLVAARIVVLVEASLNRNASRGVETTS
jgi:hypothetical protein